MSETYFDHTAIADLPYPTPFFLFSKKRIIDVYNEFVEAFPGAVIHYAMKANAEPELLRLLYENGSNFEVASKYELEFLQALSIPADRIIYGTSVKPISHIKAFHSYGVDIFAADSAAELEKIAAAAPGARIYIRMITDDAASVFKFSEKFGTQKEMIVPLLLHARSLGLRPYGISFNVGSQSGDTTAWKRAIVELVPIMEALTKEGITIEILDIGGGFPCQYASSTIVPKIKEIAEEIKKGCAELPYIPKLFLEPGRKIVAESGIVVASVIARVERKTSTWLFLDAGVYNGLFETMAYQGSTRYPITSMGSTHGTGEMMFAVAGPTGDSPDIVTREVLLPSDITVGDKVMIHNVGAYSLVATCPFNGFPKPDVYFI